MPAGVVVRPACGTATRTYDQGVRDEPSPELPLASPATMRGGFEDLARVSVDVTTADVLVELRGER